jgi:hypothetical protein
VLGRWDKKAFTPDAAAPPLVRRLTRAPLLGPAVNRSWRWWFRRQVEHQYHRDNAPAVAAFRAAPPGLNAVQRSVLDDLRQRGVAVVSGAQLFGGAGPLAQLQRDVDRWLASDAVREMERRYGEQAVAGNLKSYLVRMFGKGRVLDWDSPWLRFAIEPRVLDVVNGYLGMYARINYIDVWDTVPLDREGQDVGSQQWHRDPEAPRMVKVFTYFTDVALDSGPLVVVPYSRRGDRYGRLWPQEFPRGSRPPRQELEAAIPPSDWVVCAVPAHTIVFADTSSFHRGGRAISSRRVLSTVNYVPPGSPWPRSFGVDRDAVPDGLSAPARFALMS